jgi:hypothetical protein
MKITFKLPMADELAEALCAMSDAEAGAALKAALIYQAGGEVSALPAAARNAFEGMRALIDLSQKRAEAGKSGSGAGGQSTRFAPNKRDFAPSKPIFAPSKTENPPKLPDNFDPLAGLDAFLS